jgi:hypothetical protein
MSTTRESSVSCDFCDRGGQRYEDLFPGGACKYCGGPAKTYSVSVLEPDSQGAEKTIYPVPIDAATQPATNLVTSVKSVVDIIERRETPQEAEQRRKNSIAAEAERVSREEQERQEEARKRKMYESIVQESGLLKELEGLKQNVIAEKYKLSSMVNGFDSDKAYIVLRWGNHDVKDVTTLWDRLQGVTRTMEDDFRVMRIYIYLNTGEIRFDGGQGGHISKAEWQRDKNILNRAIARAYDNPLAF